MDKRIATAVSFCGGVGSIRTLIKKGITTFHSVYFYIPRILSEGLDHPNLVSILAPRPFLVCGATDDAGMPLEGLREFEAAAKVEYESRGAGDNFKVFVEDGPHALPPSSFEKSARWLSDFLNPLRIRE